MFMYVYIYIYISYTCVHKQLYGCACKQLKRLKSFLDTPRMQYFTLTLHGTYSWEVSFWAEKSWTQVPCEPFKNTLGDWGA